MKYVELIIKTEDSLREKVVNILYDHDIYTFEENTATIVDELNQDEKNWDFIDDDAFFVEEGELSIKCYFAEDDLIDVEKLKSELKKVNIDSEINITSDEDWANNWKKYYHPIEVGEKITIKPSWEEYDNDSRIVVEIDPGMAFGTGTHETTYLCIEALEEHVKDEDVVFDIGCGSGILGIAALKLGAKNVLAVDIDAKCIEATYNNAKLNNTLNKMTIYKGNLLDVVEGRANVIVSNIIAEIIVEMIGDLKKHLNRGGLFISSGIIVEKIDMVKNALEKEEFEILEVKEKNGWALVVGREKNV